MKTVKTVQLVDEKETLFITLYAKAKDSRAKHSVLHDTKAFDILNSVDYDFSKSKRSNDNLTAIRAKHLDEWTKSFITACDNAVVIYLGCGLDSRITRINPPSTVSWYDVDFPEVIDVRKNFFTDGSGYKMIASSITDETWLKQIPAGRPALIIAEGVLEYISPEDVQNLFRRLTDYFKNGQIIFEVMSAYAAGMSKKQGVTLKWFIDDTSEIELQNSKLKKLDEVSLFQSQYIRLLPFAYRLVYKAMSLSSKWKNAMRLMRYEF